MKKYMDPEMDVIVLDNVDVIRTSKPEIGEDDTTFEPTEG